VSVVGSDRFYRLGVCQFEPVMLDKQANLAKIEDMARRAALAGADMIVFPECCVSGYPVTPDLSREVLALAETVVGPDRGPTARFLEKLSSELGLYLVVGLPERRGDVVSNSAVSVSPQTGVIGTFQKMHLWPPDREFFRPGDTFNVYEGPGGTYGVVICYDIEFPESIRSLALQGARTAVVPNACMVPWQEYPRVYCRARAMENQIFVAVANYLGKVEDVEFFGGSVIADPYGRIIAEAGTAEAVLVADVDLDLARRVTEELDYLNQRRPETYGALTESPGAPKVETDTAAQGG